MVGEGQYRYGQLPGLPEDVSGKKEPVVMPIAQIERQPGKAVSGDLLKKIWTCSQIMRTNGCKL